MSDAVNESNEEIIRRISLLDCISIDRKLAQIEYTLCSRDVVRFVNNWVWTYDPRLAHKSIPMKLYPFQEEALNWITHRYELRENGLIEKSRDMGVTWLTAAWVTHRFIFDTGFLALLGSRKEAHVDDGTVSSFFGKIRYILDQLPWFMKVPRKRRSKQDGHMILLNEERDNLIQGESTNDTFGRGARSSICFLDEYAHVNRSESIWASISQNSNCIIPVSTPNGKGNQFSDLRHEGETKVLSLHWSKHPKKSREWYEEEKRKLKPWQVAQELDLSYDRSTAGRVYQRFERMYHVAPEVLHWNRFAREHFIAWDFGIADPTAMIFGQITNEGEIQIIDTFELSGYDIDFFAQIACRQLPVEITLLEQADQEAVRELVKTIPKDIRFKHYGDHSGTARTINSKRSARDKLRDHGINLITTGHQTFDVRIAAVDNLLKLRPTSQEPKWFSPLQISPKCNRFIDALFNYKYDTDEISDADLKPKHDWTSHMVSAFEFFAINRFPADSNKPKGREVQFR